MGWVEGRCVLVGIAPGAAVDVDDPYSIFSDVGRYRSWSTDLKGVQAGVRSILEGKEFGPSTHRGHTLPFLAVDQVRVLNHQHEGVQPSPRLINRAALSGTTHHGHP